MGNTQANGGGAAAAASRASNLNESLITRGANTQSKGPAEESGSVPVNVNVQVAENGVESGNGQVAQNGNAAATHHADQRAGIPPQLQKALLPPLLPITEDYMIEMLPTYANMALYGFTTFNLLVANTVAPVANEGIVQSLLYMCPYTYIPLGVVSMVMATVATKCRRFAGVASGFMLVQLLYLLLLGGFSTIIRIQLSFMFKSEDNDKDNGSKAVLGLTIALCIMVCLVWSFLLPYPKCFCIWNYSRPRRPEDATAAIAYSTQAAEAAGVAFRAARDAVRIAKVANAGAKSAKEAADAAIVAEGAGVLACDAEEGAAAAASRAKQAALGAQESATASEKAAAEADERCKRAQAAADNAEKSLEEARAAEDKAHVVANPINSV